MIELVIASGKGGTGKTSLVGSWAVLAKNAVLIDCDVDAANLHLIVEHSVLEEHDFSCGSRASIINDKCTLCGICEEKCRFGAIRRIKNSTGEIYKIDPFACEGCGLCEKICPDNAIAFDRVTSGKWFKSASKFGPFFHARLGVAESNSGKLVSVLRQQARQSAEPVNHNLIIVDGPPGIGCPVIAAITGASYLLIITEPSLSAIHDMKRLVELAAHFRIKTGICINKYDINQGLTSGIEDYAAQNNISVHGKIPFDRLFVETQIKGKPYVEIADSKKARLVENIWKNVNEQLTLIDNEVINNKTV